MAEAINLQIEFRANIRREHVLAIILPHRTGFAEHIAPPGLKIIHALSGDWQQPGQGY